MVGHAGSLKGGKREGRREGRLAARERLVVVCEPEEIIAKVSNSSTLLTIKAAYDNSQSSINYLTDL